MTKEQFQFELDLAYRRGWEDCHRSISEILERHSPRIEDSLRRIEQANAATLAALAK